MSSYHILNGDALAERFPKKEVEGELIVARECLVDGPVNASSLEEFFELRKAFIEEAFNGGSYKEKVTPEFAKIIDIESGQIHLWFEEDLFCQINLWFICSLLYLKEVEVFLVIPKNSLLHGFGGLTKDELVTTFNHKKTLTPINVNQFALLWFAYKKDNIERLLKLGVQVHGDFPFVMEAIAAHFDRTPKYGQPGKPERLIRKIMKEKSTVDFSTIFKEFTQRAPIYGFGDLQVKRIFDQVING